MNEKYTLFFSFLFLFSFCVLPFPFSLHFFRSVLFCRCSCFTNRKTDLRGQRLCEEDYQLLGVQPSWCTSVHPMVHLIDTIDIVLCAQVILSFLFLRLLFLSLFSPLRFSSSWLYLPLLLFALRCTQPLLFVALSWYSGLPVYCGR
jgi:hypothetical protein